MDFFLQPERLTWLREEIASAGGDASTVDAELTSLLDEKAEQEADARSLMLPGLGQGLAVKLRSQRLDGKVISSIHDYLGICPGICPALARS